jgi:hypothetical protein
VLDDLQPVREMGPALTAEPCICSRGRRGALAHRRRRVWHARRELPLIQRGAAIYYFLKEKAESPT